MKTYQINFAISKFSLAHTKEPELLKDAYFNDAAINLGKAIAVDMPPQRDDELSFNGVLPTMAVTKDHQYVDYYRGRYVVMTEAEFDTLRICAARHDIAGIKEILNTAQ